MMAEAAHSNAIDTNLPSKIIEHIYLGTAYHAWNANVLSKLHITHIVCCISGSSNTSNKNVKRLMIPMDDRGYSTLSEKLHTVYPFITNALSNKENNVLIHCKSAVNRSPTITVAFLMKYKNMTLKKAHDIVSKQHELICCHHYYMDQLRELDKEIHGAYSTKPDELETTKSMMAKLREQFMKDMDNKMDDDVEDKKDEEAVSNTPSNIMDHIYLGTLSHVSDEDVLKRLKITHIVCCIADNVNADNHTIKRLMVPIDDRGRSLLKSALEEVYDFIVDALQKDTNNVLIHCRSSVNRSPSITVAFLMKYKEMTLKQAHKLVSDKHPLICLHEKYMNQLREYDKELFGAYSTKPDELTTAKSMLHQVCQKLNKNHLSLATSTMSS